MWSGAQSPSAIYWRYSKLLTEPHDAVGMWIGVDVDNGIVKRALARTILVFGAFMLAAGCAARQPNPPPGAEDVSGELFPVVTRYLYNANAPTAVMTLAGPNGVGQRGSISGIIHGWPFAHADPDGDFGEGLFSYRIDFVVTKSGTDAARMPLRARGERIVYFHPDRTAASIGPAGAAPGGEAIITDAIEMSFSFDSPASTVRITAVMRQTGARTFVWNEQAITPPQSGQQTAEASGYYSSRFGGYVFSSAL